MTKLESIKFDALRNAIYHTARRNYLETCNRWLNLIVTVSGASAVVELARTAGTNGEIALPAIAAGIASVIGLLQLVFDFGGRARTHEFLQKRFYEIVARCQEANKDALVPTLEADLTRIYADEPPTLRALDAIAYNDAADALNTGYRLKIRIWHTALRHLYPFNGTSFAWIGKDGAPALPPAQA